MSTLSIDGLMSNISWTNIVDQMIKVQRQPAAMMEAKQAQDNQKILAYQALNASMLSLKNAVSGMATVTSLSQRLATSSDPSIVTASASTTAPAGNYTLSVNALAQAHQIASQGFSALDADVGTGEFNLTVGQGADAVTTSITIDNTNNTLEGLRDAINNSSAAANAFIINNGSVYQLVISSNDTGLQGALWVTDTLAGGVAPNFYTSASSIGAPDTSGFSPTTTTSPTMGGDYTGSQDKTYTFTFNMDGTIGTTAGLKLLWDDGTGNSGALDVGDTYTADTALDVAQGTTVALSAGDATNGDAFTVGMTAGVLNSIQAAQDAEISIGSAAGGGSPVTITSSSNTITDALPGLSLNLIDADPTQTVTINVSDDTGAVKSQIQSLVSAYNDLADRIDDYTKYDADTGDSGVLLGDYTVTQIQSEIQNVLTGAVAGQPDGVRVLSNIGVSFSQTGHLVIDETKLDAALADNFDDVANLFRLSGQSTNEKVSFLNATDATVPTANGYQVDITQAATQGVFAAGSITNPASTPLVIDSTNNQFRISVDDQVSEVLTLTQGTYTSGTQLASEVQAQINGAQELPAREVKVNWVDAGATGHLEITSLSYGSVSSVAAGPSPANSAHAILGLDAGTSTDGLDVQGTINSEPATGQGQWLTGDSGNATTEGLQLLVSLGASDLVSGPEASVTVTKGVARQLNERLADLTDSTTGILSRRTASLQGEIDDLSEQIKDFDARLDIRRQRMLAQFAAMESSLAQIQAQGSYISQISWISMPSSSSSTS